MSELLHDCVRVAAPPASIWAIVDDADALARVLPGLETIEARGPGAFVATLAAKIQFLTVRADVEARLMRTSPTGARLRLTGRPRGLVGTFSAEIPFQVRAVADGARAGPADTPARSEVEYAVDLAVGGRLATFGAPLLRETFRRQVAILVANIEAEHRRRAANAESARAAEGPAAGADRQDPEPQ